ncbi:hypothetical protein DENSPDRAFT_295948 [Dentipellis sp. KUC8613]|nr:hypothetical protein DENSPDRAFT_295948 [Dentipellis sp. KUC8613]
MDSEIINMEDTPSMASAAPVGSSDDASDLDAVPDSRTPVKDGMLIYSRMQRGELSYSEGMVLIAKIKSRLEHEAALNQYTRSWEVDWIEEQKSRGLTGVKVIEVPKPNTPLKDAMDAYRCMKRGEITGDEWLAVAQQSMQEMKSNMERTVSQRQRVASGESDWEDIQREDGFGEEYIAEMRRHALRKGRIVNANLQCLRERVTKFRNARGY